jgi:hypothetical protein
MADPVPTAETEPKPASRFPRVGTTLAAARTRLQTDWTPTAETLRRATEDTPSGATPEEVENVAGVRSGGPSAENLERHDMVKKKDGCRLAVNQDHSKFRGRSERRESKWELDSRNVRYGIFSASPKKRAR